MSDEQPKWFKVKHPAKVGPVTLLAGGEFSLKNGPRLNVGAVLQNFRYGDVTLNTANNSELFIDTPNDSWFVKYEGGSWSQREKKASTHDEATAETEANDIEGGSAQDPAEQDPMEIPLIQIRPELWKAFMGEGKVWTLDSPHLDLSLEEQAMSFIQEYRNAGIPAELGWSSAVGGAPDQVRGFEILARLGYDAWNHVRVVFQRTGRTTQVTMTHDWFYWCDWPTVWRRFRIRLLPSALLLLFLIFCAVAQGRVLSQERVLIGPDRETALWGLLAVLVGLIVFAVVDAVFLLRLFWYPGDRLARLGSVVVSVCLIPTVGVSLFYFGLNRLARYQPENSTALFVLGAALGVLLLAFFRSVRPVRYPRGWLPQDHQVQSLPTAIRGLFVGKE